MVLAAALPGDPRGSDVLWCALGARGQRWSGRRSSTAASPGDGWAWSGRSPLVGAALLPAVVGVLADERPSALVWTGIALALPGIWLVSQEPGSGSDARLADGLLDGALAARGSGCCSQRSARCPKGSGYWPLVVTQVVSMVFVVVASRALGGDPTPRVAGHWLGLLAGLMATLAVLGFLLARQQGLLSVSAVLTSLYPAATVLLAVTFLHERLHRVQGLGLALCGVSVVCVALG